MSGRGRGRGAASGGRGQPRREQPPAGAVSGPGGGRGRGVSVGGTGGAGRSGGGRGGSSVSTPLPTAAVLSHDLETKVSIGSTSASKQPPPVVPPVIAASTSVMPPANTSAMQIQTRMPPTSSKAQRFPARPGFGSVGQKCIVRANHFLVQVADKDLHQYDVTITPEVISKKVCRDIMSKLVETYRESHMGHRRPAYDGRKSIYTAGELPFTSKDFVVKLIDKDNPRRERDFKVAIKFAAKADLHHLRQFLNQRQHDVPQETIQALDVALRATHSTNYTTVGRSFFDPRLGRIGDLGDGLQYWRGFYQSLRPTHMGLSLTIDVSARAFYEPILVSDFVGKYYVRDLKRLLSDSDRLKIKKALKGVRVEVAHGETIRRYKVSGISVLPSNQLMFTMEDGVQTSVVQYFRGKYNIILKYPQLPCLLAGSDTKPAFLPMEICKIVEGQRYTKKLNERQVTALLKATCQRPPDRERSIRQMVENNNYNSDDIAQEFGINVSSELTTVNARILQPPTLKYHDTGRETRVNPRVGQWNMIDKKMVNGGTVEFWTCVNFSRLHPDFPFDFCQQLSSMCNSKGMTFKAMPLVPIRTANPSQIEKTLCEIHKESVAKLASTGQTGKQLQMLIIILPDVTGSYGKIKRICETELGIVSQCCQPKQASKLSPQYLENVALKINVKVGGRNTVLVNAIERRIPLVSDRPTIIIGADVTHPMPGEDTGASIAAVVASMDWPEITKYRGLVSAQYHREEMIQDLYKTHQDSVRGTVHGGLIREHLIAFRRSTGHKPHRIIFYRDGVSEGQFSHVLLHEVDAIRKACHSLEENYMPPITFVVVQKRHHTRLFPADHGNRNSTDKSGNILPGTVVDSTICHPTEFDFYLCSHAGIQGTSRPAHYHVLYDENKFTADGLQMLTNSLCYTYARCTKSVSIVPPAYYAHLAAFRARYYIEGEVSDLESSSEGVRGATRERTADVRALPAIKENVKDVMFYC